jgi:peptidoglycan/LPS O-acetylase OafA/YrhL
MWARLVRIGPTHVLTLACITPLCLWLNTRGALLTVSSGPVVHWPLALKAWLANLFLVQVFCPTLQYEQMYNAPAWSVSCEMIFYLFFPLLLVVLTPLAARPRRLMAIACLCWLAEVAIIFFLLHGIRKSVGRAHEAWPIDFYVYRMPFVRIGEFAVGCCSGLLFVNTRGRRLPSPNALLAIGCVVLLILLGIFGCFPFFSYTSYIIAFTPGFAVVVFALASGCSVVTALLQHPAVMLLGEASYALYLLHWTPYLWIRWQYGYEAPGWYSSTAAAVCVAASVVFLLTLDIPIRRLLRGGYTTERRRRSNLLA